MFYPFKKKKEPENLKELLLQFKDLKRDFEKISKELENLKEEGKFSVQKVGIIRFNPFKDVGGNQSFSIALLDGNDDGLVLTSLYTKEGNRVYGKPIKAGLSEYLLSGEEKEAIEYAKRKKSKFGPEGKQASYGTGNTTAGGGGLGTH